MAHPGDRMGKGKSVIVSFRLSPEVHAKIKKNHPNVAEYIRQFVEFHHTRSHKSKGIRANYYRGGK